MSPAQCACGFTEDETADETLDDHLLEMFAPEDGRAADGLVHLEGEAELFCMCGAGGSANELDAHFLAVFMSTDQPVIGDASLFELPRALGSLGREGEKGSRGGLPSAGCSGRQSRRRDPRPPP
jgi:hypothetical protein